MCWIASCVVPISTSLFPEKDLSLSPSLSPFSFSPSQMTKLLDILDYFLEERGHKAARIDGHVALTDRRAQIEDFNDPKSDLSVFLLSTRAGKKGTPPQGALHEYCCCPCSAFVLLLAL